MALIAGSRILIADDHAPTRALVREALERHGFMVVAEAATAAQAIEAAERVPLDLALLDIRMPGSGIDAAQAISALPVPPIIVMLTVSEEDEDLFAALGAGASGYLLKGMDTRELPAKLQAVLEGAGILSKSLMDRLVSEFRFRERRRLLTTNEDRRRRLTAREWEVLELMAAGLSTSEIAARSYISPVTVRTHISAIVRKLQVPDRHAAVALFERAR
jgi:two-component system nitrate/nitrite response regulator NarL